MRLLLIDNYDSFVFNLYHYLFEVKAGLDIDVIRNDRIGIEAALAPRYDAIVISPGPGTPADAGIIVDLVRRAAGRKPILGVCLGHQAIGAAYGATIERAPAIMHGKTSAIDHDGTGLFAELPSPLKATRYHSLVIDRASLPDTFTVNAEVDNIIMAMHHSEYPLYGVQFHPESIASEHGKALLAQFLQRAENFNHRNDR